MKAYKSVARMMVMAGHIIFALGILLFAAGADDEIVVGQNGGIAQNDENTASPKPPQDPPPAGAQEREGRAPQDAAGPRPAGEEVMHPTKRGLRLTPGLAQAMSRLIVDSQSKDLSLSERQQKDMAEMYARGMMRAAHKNAPQLQGAFESLLEWAASNEHGPGPGQTRTPEASKKLAEQSSPLIPEVRQLLKDYETGAKDILNPEQFEKFQEGMKKDVGKELDKFEQRMKRWAEGEVKPGEDPFNGPREEPGDQKKDDKPPSEEELKRKQTMEAAQWAVERTYHHYGPDAWSRFLGGAKNFFKFDERQSARGDELLKEYRAKAEQIMTEPWKAQIRRNRIRHHLRTVLKNQPAEPWAYHLESEFDDLIKPLSELGDKFIGEIMALIDKEQRRQALETLQKAAVRHGLGSDDLDPQALGLAGEQFHTSE